MFPYSGPSMNIGSAQSHRLLSEEKANLENCGRMSTTVNVVILAGGKFQENVGKTFHVGVIFKILLLFPS